MTYISEITPLRFRSKVTILVGMSFSLSNIIIPSLAWLILPQDWDFEVIAEYFCKHLRTFLYH